MTMICCDLHKKLIGTWKYYWFFPFFIKKERHGKNELKEARKILNNVSFGSSFNNLGPGPNVELFIRRAKFSELSSWKVWRLPKLTLSEWVWIIQHLLSTLHWRLNVAREKWGFHQALRGKTRFQRLSPFSDSYEIYSKQQLLDFQERIQKEKE